ncbi:MAG: hypothetical protein QOF02_222 [Blastocatellia bacterium]|jgi:hypothetical protein|nr:hypothetical protein [Blastocatellia bacterium]
MPNKIFVPLVSLALVACAATFARAQQDPNQEDVRGAFLSTRVTVATSTSGTPTTTRNTRKQNRTTTTRNTSKGTTAKGTGKVGVGAGTKGVTGKSTSGGDSTGTGKIPINSYSSAPIGLGYSLYMRDSNGDAVRVDPSRVFRAGDRIRISLEANTDGYLYVFHTENNGEPQMLYPDAKLDEGDNFIEAHVPYEIPWSGEAADNLRWFVFDQNPANERLYIVISREPLPGVPTNEQLISYCRSNQCPWRPATSLWSQVRVNSEGKVVVDKKAATYGQKQTASERDATTRGLSLGTSAPEPSVVRMNASSNAGVLVTALDLIHQ